MLKPGRIAAIISILVAASLAWIILGFTILSRTYDTDTRLKQRVASTWGTAQQQRPPAAYREVKVPKRVVKQVDGTEVVETRQVTRRRPLHLVRSRLRARLELEPRQKGLLWYSTYRVAFSGDYTFQNTSKKTDPIRFAFPLPAEKAVYDDLSLKLDGKEMELEQCGDEVRTQGEIPPGGTGTLSVSYRSQGLDSWTYLFGDSVTEVRDFDLAVTTDFDQIDFADNSLSPVSKSRTADGWKLGWTYDRLLSGYRIRVDMPEKLQPGPLAGRISFFAPVSLLFFFFVLFLVTTIRKIDLHPMNYFFLAGAFFSFHLLLAYLADHISIHAAFLISSVVSLFLVISYLRLVVGMRFAALEAGGAQLLYLVLFSYAFFFKGFTGLTITIGAILSLFVAMQLTGRVRWSESQPPRGNPAR